MNKAPARRRPGQSQSPSPVAVFLSFPAEVEKRFERDGVNVLGRACTARETGDVITFLVNQ